MNFQFISSRGDILDLARNDSFQLINFDNQTAAMSDISSAIIGGSDGDTVNNIQAQPRSAILDLQILKDVELTKRKILQAVKLKQSGTIRWTQGNKTLELTGTVESIEMQRWTNSTIMQITLHCSQPFWQDIDKVVSEINEYIPLHYFTGYQNDMLFFPEVGTAFGEYDITRRRIIRNAGDVSVGLEIEINAFDTVTNPILYRDDSAFFGIGHGTGAKQVVMQAGDIIKINTGKDQKSVTLNGQNLLSKIKPNSTWLQLEAGENIFSINSDDEAVNNMTFSLTYKRRYI